MDFATARVDKSLSVTHGDDAGLWVEFHRKAIQNNFKSTEAGRPIFDEFDYVDIVIPGGKTKVSRKATEQDKERFKAHWALYQAKQNGATGDAVIGTPLDQWPALSTSQVHEMRAMGIRTVDQIANLNDQGIQAIGMGGRELKAKAVAFLASASGNAEFESLAAENERLSEQLALQKKQMDDMAARVEALTRQMSATTQIVPQLNAGAQIPDYPTDQTPEFEYKVPAAPLYEAQPVEIPKRRGRPPKS